MIRLCVLFIDGSFVDKEFPDHEINDVEDMIEGTPRELLCRVELEDRNENLVYSYKRKTNYAY